jgi:hypothetical protein
LWPKCGFDQTDFQGGGGKFSLSYRFHGDEAKVAASRKDIDHHLGMLKTHFRGFIYVEICFGMYDDSDWRKSAAQPFFP